MVPLGYHYTACKEMHALPMMVHGMLQANIAAFSPTLEHQPVQDLHN